MRGFRRAYKQGEGEGEGEGEAYDRMYFLFTGRWSFNRGGRDASTWGGLISGSLGYCVKAL